MSAIDLLKKDKDWLRPVCKSCGGDGSEAQPYDSACSVDHQGKSQSRHDCDETCQCNFVCKKCEGAMALVGTDMCRPCLELWRDEMLASVQPYAKV